MARNAVDSRGVPSGAARFEHFVETYARAWADPASGELAELWTEDAEAFHPESREPKRGREEIAAYVGQILALAPDLRLEVVDAAAAGDTLYIEFRCSGTFAGSRVEWGGVDRFDVRTGSAQAHRGVGFFDTAPVRDAVLGAAASRTPHEV